MNADGLRAKMEYAEEVVENLRLRGAVNAEELNALDWVLCWARTGIVVYIRDIEEA